MPSQNLRSSRRRTGRSAMPGG